MEKFNESTSTYEVDIDDVSIKLLHPLLILNAKCRSMLGRATDSKKNSDADDIRFLLRWMVSNGIFPTALQLPNVSREFVEVFTTKFGGEQAWKNAGYSFDKGCHFLLERWLF